MSDAPPPDRYLLARMVKADFGRGDPTERARLAALLDRDPEMRARHDDMQFLWDMLGELDPADERDVAPDATSSGNVRPLRPRWIPAPARFAGRAIAAAVIGGVILTAVVGGLSNTTGAAHAFTIETGKAERRIAGLPDGSSVELSGESRVTVDYSSGRRLLRIETGEAYVRAVAGHAPMIVRAGNGEVHIAGSADVKLVRGDVLVTMVSGSAEVVVPGNDIDARQSTRLFLGQQVRFGPRDGAAPGSMMTTPRSVSVPGALDWTRGLLEFHGEPLADVIDEVNRHSTGRVVLLDQTQAKTPIYGVLHIGDLDGLASMLADQQTTRGRFAHVVRIDAAPD